MLRSHTWFLLALRATAIKYGCWSEASNKFDADCLVAFTSLLAENTGYWDDQVYLPNVVQSYTVGDCTANICGSNYRLPISLLLDAGDMLTARCQNGFFYLDDRSIEANLVHLRSSAKIFLMRYVIGVRLSLHLRDWKAQSRPNLAIRAPNRLAKRPAPPGPVVGATFSSALGGLRIIRSSTGSYRLSNLHWNASLVFSYVLDMLRTATVDHGFTLQRASATIMADGAESLALVMQLGGTHDTWTALFGASLDVSPALSRLWGGALFDWAENQFTASVYHVVDDQGDVVVTCILNAVAGVLDPLPA